MPNKAVSYAPLVIATLRIILQSLDIGANYRDIAIGMLDLVKSPNTFVPSELHIQSPHLLTSQLDMERQKPDIGQKRGVFRETTIDFTKLDIEHHNERFSHARSFERLSHTWDERVFEHEQRRRR